MRLIIESSDWRKQEGIAVFSIERDFATMRFMHHRKFNKLQDEYFEVSKRMHEAKTVQEKMTLLIELRRILKESEDALEEIHEKQTR